MRLINYYLKKKFNPVPLKVNEKKDFFKHLKLRVNLIENHLKIPLSLLNEKNVLEFGPNRGENSMLYAIYGAKLYFVEPIKESCIELKKKYEKFKLINSIKRIQNSSLEKFKSKTKFDFVIAEGFLNTLDNREKYLIKLFKTVKKEGLVLINYDDYYGSFNELLKSAILKKICLQKKIKLDSNDSLKISKKLFYQDFKKLRNTRPFKAYWLDQLSCEFAQDVWKLKNILNIAKKNNFYYYSSSPSWQTSNNLTWYKDINLNRVKNSNKSILNEWFNNFDYFLTGNNNNQFNFDKKKLIRQLDQLTLRLIKFLKQNNKIIFSEFNIKNNPYFKDVNLIIKFLNSDKEKLNYKKLKNFRLSTGTNLHYLCLKKNEKNFI